MRGLLTRSGASVRRVALFAGYSYAPQAPTWQAAPWPTNICANWELSQPGRGLRRTLSTSRLDRDAFIRQQLPPHDFYMSVGFVGQRECSNSLMLSRSLDVVMRLPCLWSVMGRWKKCCVML